MTIPGAMLRGLWALDVDVDTLAACLAGRHPTSGPTLAAFQRDALTTFRVRVKRWHPDLVGPGNERTLAEAKEALDWLKLQRVSTVRPSVSPDVETRRTRHTISRAAYEAALARQRVSSPRISDALARALMQAARRVDLFAEPTEDDTTAHVTAGGFDFTIKRRGRTP